MAVFKPVLAGDVLRQTLADRQQELAQAQAQQQEIIAQQEAALAEFQAQQQAQIDAQLAAQQQAQQQASVWTSSPDKYTPPTTPYTGLDPNSQNKIMDVITQSGITKEQFNAMTTYERQKLVDQANNTVDKLLGTKYSSPEQQAQIRKNVLRKYNADADAVIDKGVGFFEGLGDIGQRAAMGFRSGLGSIVRAVDPNGNWVTRKIDEAQIESAKNLSDASRSEEQRAIDRIQAAEKSGEGELRAKLSMAYHAPAETLAGLTGAMAPTVVASIASGGAAAPATVGALMGVGSVRGQQYDTIYEDAIASGKSKEDAAQLANKSTELLSSDNLSNTGQTVAGGVLGAIAGSTGVQSTLGKLIRGGAEASVASKIILNNPLSRTIRAIEEAPGLSGVTKRAVLGGLKEAVPEAAQNAQQQYAGNVASTEAGVMPAGYDNSRGVFSEAGTGFVLGGLMGAAVDTMAGHRGTSTTSSPTLNTPQTPVTAPDSPSTAAVKAQEFDDGSVKLWFTNLNPEVRREVDAGITSAAQMPTDLPDVAIGSGHPAEEAARVISRYEDVLASGEKLSAADDARYSALKSAVDKVTNANSTWVPPGSDEVRQPFNSAPYRLRAKPEDTETVLKNVTAVVKGADDAKVKLPGDNFMSKKGSYKTAVKEALTPLSKVRVAIEAIYGRMEEARNTLDTTNPETAARLDDHNKRLGYLREVEKILGTSTSIDQIASLAKTPFTKTDTVTAASTAKYPSAVPTENIDPITRIINSTIQKVQNEYNSRTAGEGAGATATTGAIPTNAPLGNRTTENPKSEPARGLKQPSMRSSYYGQTASYDGVSGSIIETDIGASLRTPVGDIHIKGSENRSRDLQRLGVKLKDKLRSTVRTKGRQDFLVLDGGNSINMRGKDYKILKVLGDTVEAESVATGKIVYIRRGDIVQDIKTTRREANENPNLTLGNPTAEGATTTPEVMAAALAMEEDIKRIRDIASNENLELFDLVAQDMIDTIGLDEFTALLDKVDTAVANLDPAIQSDAAMKSIFEIYNQRNEQNVDPKEIEAYKQQYEDQKESAAYAGQAFEDELNWVGLGLTRGEQNAIQKQSTGESVLGKQESQPGVNMGLQQVGEGNRANEETPGPSSKAKSEEKVTPAPMPESLSPKVELDAGGRSLYTGKKTKNRGAIKIAALELEDSSYYVTWRDDEGVVNQKYVPDYAAAAKLASDLEMSLETREYTQASPETLMAFDFFEHKLNSVRADGSELNFSAMTSESTLKLINKINSLPYGEKISKRVADVAMWLDTKYYDGGGLLKAGLMSIGRMHGDEAKGRITQILKDFRMGIAAANVEVNRVSNADGSPTNYDMEQRYLDFGKRLSDTGMSQIDINELARALNARSMYERYGAVEVGFEGSKNKNLTAFLWSGEGTIKIPTGQPTVEATINGEKVQAVDDYDGLIFLSQLTPEQLAIANELENHMIKWNDSVIALELLHGRITEDEAKALTGVLYMPNVDEKTKVSGTTSRKGRTTRSTVEPFDAFAASIRARILRIPYHDLVVATHNMLAEYPNSDFLQLNPQKPNRADLSERRKVDEVYQDIVTSLDADPFREGSFKTVYNGKEIVITPTNPKHRELLQTRSPPAIVSLLAKAQQMGSLTRVALVPVTQMSMHLRDAIQSFLNIQAAFPDLSNKDAMRLGLQVARNIIPNWKTTSALVLSEGGLKRVTSSDPLVQRQVTLYRDVGGGVSGGMASRYGVDLTHSRLEDLIARSTGTEGLGSKALRVGGEGLKYLHSLNEVYRHGAWYGYLELKHGGKFESVEQFDTFIQQHPEYLTNATLGSKDLLGDFDSRGSSNATTWARAIFPFFTATMRGNKTLFNALMHDSGDGKLNHFQRGAGLLAIAVMATTLADIELGGEDDSGKSKASQRQKQGSSLMVGEFAFPVPPEMQAYVTTIKNFMYMINGDISPSKFASHALFDNLMTWSPWNVTATMDSENSGAGAILGITPFIFQGLVQSAMGVDAFGNDLYAKDAYDAEGTRIKNPTDNLLKRNGDPAWMVALSEGLNGIGVEVSPTTLEVNAQALGGGVYSSIIKPLVNTALGNEPKGGIVNKLINPFQNPVVPQKVNQRFDDALSNAANLVTGVPTHTNAKGRNMLDKTPETEMYRALKEADSQAQKIEVGGKTMGQAVRSKIEADAAGDVLRSAQMTELIDAISEKRQKIKGDVLRRIDNGEFK